MPLRLNPARGGFTRATGLGEFIRFFLSGKLEAPILDPDTRELTGFAGVEPHAGAPAQDIWARYKDFLFVAWGQELVEQWRREGREIPEDPEAFSEAERTARARIPQRLTGMRLNSFYRYFHNLRELGWVEFTGQEEGSLPRMFASINFFVCTWTWVLTHFQIFSTTMEYLCLVFLECTVRSKSPPRPRDTPALY